MNDINKFDALVYQVTKFVSPAMTIKVSDNTAANDAVETGKQIKEYQKKIETLRKELVGPLNEQVKEINDYAKKISYPLNSVESHLKTELSKFADAQEKIRQEERAKLQAMREAEQKRIEAEKQELFAKLKAEADISKTSVEDLSILVINEKKESEYREANKEIKAQEKEIEATAIKGVKRPWKAEVIDELKVPREYMIVDMRRINEAVRAGVRDIPGVTIFQETSISFGKTTAVPIAAQIDDYFN